MSVKLFRGLSQTIGCMSAVLFLSASTSTAQTTNASWQIRPSDGFDADGGTAHGVFGPRNDLELEFTIANEEDAPTWLIVDPAFFREIGVTVTSRIGQGRLAEIKQWRDEAVCGGPFAPAACSTNARTVLRQGHWLKATVTLSSVEARALAEGDYQVSVDLTPARKWLLGEDLTIWPGRLLERGSVPLVVRMIRTSADRRSYYRIEGGGAMKRRDFTAALRTYQQMASDFPDDPTGPAGIGAALLQLGRLREAASYFERTLSISEGGESSIPAELALAYIGLGQLERAEATLRRYYAAGAIPEILATLRARATRLMRER